MAAKKNPAAKEEAFRLIACALEHGEGYAYLRDDSDLDPLRKMPEFQKLLDFVKTVKDHQKNSAKR